MRPTPMPLVSATLRCQQCCRKFRVLDWNEKSFAAKLNDEYLKHHRYWHRSEGKAPIEVILRCEECLAEMAVLTTSTTTIMSVGKWVRHQHNQERHGLARSTATRKLLPPKQARLA